MYSNLLCSENLYRFKYVLWYASVQSTELVMGILGL